MQAGYLPPPPGVSAEPLRPSGWWFGFAATLGVVGVAAAIVIFVRTFGGWVDRIDEFQRVQVPGQGTVTLDDTGGFSIYHEFPGAGDRFGPDLLDVTLTAPDGSEVPLRNYTSNVTYTTGDHDGVALFSFTADEPGAYVLSAQGSDATLAVGRGIGNGLVAGILTGVGVGVGSVVAAIVIAVVVGIRRSNARARLRLPPPGSPGGYGAPAWGQQPAGPGGWGAPSPYPPASHPPQSYPPGGPPPPTPPPGPPPFG